MTGLNRNMVWARVFLDELARAGVREVSIAPGSRSAPLVLAAVDDSRLAVFTHLDERSAAFFALGIGKRAGRPAAVVTTSGTAAANLYPAVVEAAQSETPLLLLTADRPHRLRGADANQAIDQNRLFGSYVREFVETAPPDVSAPALTHLRALAVRCVASALGVPAGPVHVNLPFAKPLEPSHAPGDVPPGFDTSHPLAARGRSKERPLTRIGVRRSAPSPEAVSRLADRIGGTVRGLVVAGPSSEPERDGPAAATLAEATGFPLLADALSGARFGPSRGAARISGYDLFLRPTDLREALRPELVVRVGGAPTSGALNSFLAEAQGVEQWVVDSGGRWKDHLNVATEYVRADLEAFAHALSRALGRAVPGREAMKRAVATPSPEVPPDAAGPGPSAVGDRGSVIEAWRQSWIRAGEVSERTVRAQLDGELFEGVVLTEVVRAAPRASTIFVSSSMPVRDLDAFGFPRDEDLAVYGNRGASGIDGIVSSAAGVAAAEGARVLAVIGDVAFAHDMNGLLAARDHAEVVFVLINNDGGGIFHMLPIREYEPAFTNHFATPHGLDFSHAARLYGLPHTRVGSRAELASCLEKALEDGGSCIIEVGTDRERNRRRREEIIEAVREALSEEPSIWREQA